MGRGVQSRQIGKDSMSEEHDSKDVALIRNDLRHMQQTVEDGFGGVHSRLDRVNGTVAENVKSIHQNSTAIAVLRATCEERGRSAQIEGQPPTMESLRAKLPDVQTLTKYGVQGAVGLGGATLIILLLLRAWGYL